MLTGELPIGRFAPPSKKVQIDVRLDEVVLRALEKEPDLRYQQASEVKTEVETIAATPRASHDGLTPNAAIEQARRQVRGPAVGLIVTSVLNWLAIFVLVLAALPSAARQGVSPGFFLLAAAILALGSAVILVGALKMQRLESLALARWAAVAAMLIGPGYLVGWPVGIWSLVVLARPEVVAAFRKGERGVAQKGMPGWIKIPLWSVLAAVVLAIVVQKVILNTHAGPDGDGGTVARQPNEVERTTSQATPGQPDSTESPAMGDPPRLRFLAWQDESQDWSKGRAWHADGTPVTDRAELQVLANVPPTGFRVGYKETEASRFLHLWFSHPGIDRQSSQQVALLDSAENAIPLMANGSFGSSADPPNPKNENLGWIKYTLSPGTVGHTPKTVNIRLEYSVGPWKYDSKIARL